MSFIRILTFSISITLASLSNQNKASVAALGISSQNEKTISVDENDRNRIHDQDYFDRQLDTLDQRIFKRLLSDSDEDHSEDHSDADHSDEEDSHEGHDHSDEEHSDEDGHEGHGHDEGEHKTPWGSVIGATILVNVVTLVGILTFIPLMVKNKGNCFNATFWATSADTEKESKEDEKEAAADPEKQFKDDEASATTFLLSIFVPSFACGALLATAFFLIIPESIAFIQNAVSKNQDEDAHEGHEGHEDEELEILPGAIVRFATSLLAGYMLPLVLGTLFPKPSENDDASEPGKKINLRLVSSILIGDAAHNFCDGIFIGVAFMTCSKSIAWSIVGVTIYHEVAQEIADFFLLIKHAGLNVWQALLFNFVAGISVIIGGLMILGLNIGDMAIGVILAFSGGVYTYIAASECLPRVDSVVKDGKDKLYSIIFFLIGAIPIGLTLLNHEHCG